MTEQQIKWLAATPRLNPASAGEIVKRAHAGGTGIAFGIFARHQFRFFDRIFVKDPGPHLLYRLTEEGCERVKWETGK